jgi:hypothetical protein
MSTLDLLKSAFTGTFQLKEKRPNIFQVVAPFFHEDGDMMEIFVEPTSNDRYRICDYGLTLMHLSYNVNLTESKENLYNRIISENGLDEQDGNIFIESDFNNLLPSFFHFAQALAKVSSLQYLKKKAVQNLFYDMLIEHIQQKYADIPYKLKATPIPSNKECVVDVMFEFPRHPLFLFGVKENDNQKALEIAANCFEFKTENINFQSVVVYENYDTLTNKNQKRLLRATDKQFLDFDQFKNEGRRFIENVA